MLPCVLLLTSALTDMQASSTSQPCTSAPFCATPPVSVGAFDSVLVVVILAQVVLGNVGVDSCSNVASCVANVSAVGE